MLRERRDQVGQRMRVGGRPLGVGWALGALGLGVVLGTTAATRAQVALPVREAEAGTLRIDGALGEWRDVRFLEVGSGPDASMRVALAYDAAGLYVGAEVRDERFVPGEDGPVLTLALPRGAGTAGVEVELRPGEPGRSAGAVRVGALGRRSAAVRDARLVESLAAGGYVVEAFIPWRALPGSDRWQEGRGTLRLRDVDLAARPEVESEPSLTPVDPSHLERLPALRPSGGPSAVFEEFLASRGLDGARPSFDLRGDVGADGRAERVSIVDRTVVVTGPGWQEGRGYAFLDLRVASAGDVLGAELVELTGDQAMELVVRLREREAGGVHDVWQVVAFSEGQARAVFALEIGRTVGDGRIDAPVRVVRGRRGQPPSIELRPARVVGVEAGTTVPAPREGVEPLLVPWGPTASRRYVWDGAAFTRGQDTPNRRFVDPAAASPSGGPSAPGPEALLSAFRRSRGLSDGLRPTFRFRADVGEDTTPEEIAVYGRDLAVVGPGFRGGTGWFSFELPAADPSDVLDVRGVDVTGDARSEFLVRVRQSLGDVQREVLLVFGLRGDAFPLLLAREVARVQGSLRVENEVVPSRGALEIRPGRATGWTADSWPFGATAPQDGVEPLTLPWRDGRVRYRLDGERLIGR